MAHMQLANVVWGSLFSSMIDFQKTLQMPWGPISNEQMRASMARGFKGIHRFRLSGLCSQWKRWPETKLRGCVRLNRSFSGDRNIAPVWLANIILRGRLGYDEWRIEGAGG